MIPTLEVDAVIELRDGRWAGIEVKLGDNKAEEGARSLLRLRDKVAANPAARNPEPSFLMVLVAKRRFAIKRRRRLRGAAYFFNHLIGRAFSHVL